MKYFTLIAVFVGLVAVASACGSSGTSTGTHPTTKHCPTTKPDHCDKKNQKKCDAEGVDAEEAEGKAQKKAENAAKNVPKK